MPPKRATSAPRASRRLANIPPQDPAMPDPPTVQDPTITDMQHSLQNLTTMFSQMQEQMQQMQQQIQQMQHQAPQPEAVTNQPGIIREETPPCAPGDWIFLFLDLHPDEFNGMGDCMESEYWITHMENLFNIMKCPDRQRINLATFQLRGEADLWWRITKGSLGDAVETLTWAEFVKLFYKRYFPSTARREKAREFINLRQNNLTVDQYKSQFSMLSRFAPDLVVDENARCRLFEDGLKPSIRVHVRVHMHQNYNELVNTARVVERDCEGTYQAHGARVKRHEECQRGGVEKRMRSQTPTTIVSSGSVSSASITPPSQSPGPDTRICYYCQQPGHIVRYCPQNIW